MYGCLKPDENAEEGTFRVILPTVETLFDECYWQPFVDTTTPNKSGLLYIGVEKKLTECTVKYYNI